MKTLAVRLALSIGLVIMHGCTNGAETNLQDHKSENSQASSAQQQSNPHIPQTQKDTNTKSSQKVSNSPTQSVSSETTAKLTSPRKISSTQGVPLEIQVQNQGGKAVEQFEAKQEKPMSLIAVSHDLRFFNRIHPDYAGKGKFAIKHDFPAPGDYTLFTEYKPSGENKQVGVEKISIPGNVPIPNQLESFSANQTIGNTTVQLKSSPSQPKAGKQIKFNFNLIDASKKKSVKDLQAYLGKKAHLSIIRSSSPLTAADYIQAQVLDSKKQGQLEFTSKFPQKGTYKMWLQFQRQGQVITAPFWVNVN